MLMDAAAEAASLCMVENREALQGGRESRAAAGAAVVAMLLRLQLSIWVLSTELALPLQRLRGGLRWGVKRAQAGDL
eukprot:scaffold62908_cov17-Tisochrysis_lutea.AAC.1